MLREKAIAPIKQIKTETLKQLVNEAEAVEFVEWFNDLKSEEQVISFRLLAKEQAMAVFEQLDTDHQHNLLRSFTEDGVREFVNQLAPDDRVKLLDEMPATVAKKLISTLSREERDTTNLLLGYKPETAGRLMTTEFISLNKNITAEQAMDKVRLQAKDKETIYTLFVTSNTKKLQGVLSLKELIVAESNAIIEDIMSKNIISVTTDTDQEEAAKVLQELDLLAIPVVDKENRLVGIVTIDDAVDIMEEEVTEDIFDAAGLADITGNEADRSEVLINGNLWSIWKVRLPILLITMVIFMFAGLIMDGFEETLQANLAVAMFIPLIMGMSGNVGTQSSAVFARGVVLGQIQMANFWRPFAKEIVVGLSIGIVLGTATGVIAGIWQEPMLGISVGLALTLAITAATTLGFFVPFALIKLNIDQTAGSAPIITTIKDILALLIYFVAITIFLGTVMNGTVEAVEYDNANSGYESSQGEESAENIIFMRISAEEAYDMMGEIDIVVLDVRNQNEFDTGHIRNAVLLPVDEISAETTAWIDAAQTILIYCQSGVRSLRAAEMFIELGFTNVYEFGGIVDWVGEVVQPDTAA